MRSISRLFHYYLLIFRHITVFLFFFFNDTATTEIYTLSLHDALPISSPHRGNQPQRFPRELTNRISSSSWLTTSAMGRSEEHTSELQSPCNLVCRLLLEKKKKKKKTVHSVIMMHIQSV